MILRQLLCSPITSFIWLLFALITFYIDIGTSLADHNRYLLYVYISYFLCLYCWIGRGNRVLSLFVLFVLFSLFYNTSQSFVYAITKDFSFLHIYNSYTLADVCYMLKYEFLCISGFCLGISVYLNKKSHNVSHNEVVLYYKKKRKENNNMNRFFIIFVICSIAVFAYTIYQLILRQTISYGELYESRETISPYFSLGTMLIGLYYILIKCHVKLVLLLYVWFIFAYTLAGTRSMTIVYIGALFLIIPILYPQYFQRKYYPLIFALILLGFFSISVFSQLRNSSIGSTMALETNNMPIYLASLKEMGISQLSTLITIDNFDKAPYSQTIFYFVLLSFIPSFILESVLPESWGLRLGSWVTNISNTTYVQWGSSWIAESYLNFGQFGWLFTFLYGYLIVYAENSSLRRILRGDYLLSICVLTCLCKQLFFARAEIHLLVDYFKPCIYILAIYYLTKKESKKTLVVRK